MNCVSTNNNGFFSFDNNHFYNYNLIPIARSNSGIKKFSQNKNFIKNKHKVKFTHHNQNFNHLKSSYPIANSYPSNSSLLPKLNGPKWAEDKEKILSFVNVDSRFNNPIMPQIQDDCLKQIHLYDENIKCEEQSSE